jgi:hypothetical protein
MSYGCLPSSVDRKQNENVSGWHFWDPIDRKIMRKDNSLKKMTSIIAAILLYAIGFYWVFFVPDKKDKIYINEVCKTKRAQVAGVINGFGGHGIYQWVEVNNMKKSLFVRVAKIKFAKGFPDDYVDYRVGDSLIKEANSKEFIIKRDTCMAVYVLDCDN